MTVDAAANPEEKASPYLAPSNDASFSSNAFLVGLRLRVYSYPAVGLSAFSLAKVVDKCIGTATSPLAPSLKSGSSPL